MNVVLFTWNPDKWTITDRIWHRQIQQIQDGGFLYGQWSAGNSTKLIKPGDTALLLRQGRDRGIVARGTVTSDVFEELSWNDELEEDATDNYVDITWTEQLPITARLRIEDLQQQLPEVAWVRYSSGTTVDPQYHDRLLQMWDDTVRTAGFARRPGPSPVSAPRELVESQNGTCSLCRIDPQILYRTTAESFLTIHTFDSTGTTIAVCPNCQQFASRLPAAQSPRELEQLMQGQY